ncbi:MAG: AIPR family protein [Syntrophales bacterium]
MIQEKKSTLSSFLDLPFLEYQTIEKDNWVLYMLSVRLEDYWKLVSKESGDLRRYLFDSGGWDFLWLIQINEEKARTLANPADNWSLNNGVTIIVTNATVLGKTIQLQDIQIINGLKPTKIIYHHFQGDSATSKDRILLVQIIVPSDAQIRDQIIEAASYQGQPVTIIDLQAICNAQNSLRYRGDS